MEESVLTWQSWIMHSNGEHLDCSRHAVRVLLMVTPFLNRWTESIAQKVKRKKQIPEHTKKKIWRSVFEPTIPQALNYGFVRSL